MAQEDHGYQLKLQKTQHDHQAKMKGGLDSCLEQQKILLKILHL